MSLSREHEETLQELAHILQQDIIEFSLKHNPHLQDILGVLEFLKVTLTLAMKEPNDENLFGGSTPETEGTPGKG